jgi:hypothetical protein
MTALDQRDGQDPTCLPPDLLHSEVLSYLGPHPSIVFSYPQSVKENILRLQVRRFCGRGWAHFSCSRVG